LANDTIKREAAELLYRCPYPGRHANGDSHPSLKVNAKKDTWACFVCNASGTAWALAAFIAGVEPSDKHAVSSWLRERGLLNGGRAGEDKSQFAAEYNYTDETGGFLFQVVRLQPKGFRQRRREENGDWTWGVGNTRRVLYRLPEVLSPDAKSILICEGEKDCETARAMGIVATTNSGGAGKWREEYSEHLSGKETTIIADADEPGRKHAQLIAESLHGKAASVRLLEMPGAKDLSEWVDRGGTREALQELIALAPECKPRVKSAPGQNGFRLVPLGELLDRPQTETEWVWSERLAVGTVSLVVAKPRWENQLWRATLRLL
jgi:5S rRNA maturation endonuclease (ribonuclease M5)